LIVPSVTAMLFSERLGPRLAIGWSMGALVSAGGVALSYGLDLPTGATIVATFGGALLVVAGFRRALRRQGASALTLHARSGRSS
jgi:ABC-type Mn2+/Zn2+ transport system permease subunit